VQVLDGPATVSGKRPWRKSHCPAFNGKQATLKDKLVLRKTYLPFSTEGRLSAGWEGSQKSNEPQVRRPARHVGTC
jgi:hypothetical protein